MTTTYAAIAVVTFLTAVLVIPIIIGEVVNLVRYPKAEATLYRVLTIAACFLVLLGSVWECARWSYEVWPHPLLRQVSTISWSPTSTLTQRTIGLLVVSLAITLYIGARRES